MFNNTSHYILREETYKGVHHYYISFIDGQAVPRETEVLRPIYLEFCRFVKQERNLRRSDERHIEQSELTDETLYNRALNPPKTIEEAVFNNLRNELFRKVIAKLPETQRRRFILHHEFGLTYEQIAGIEGCTFQAVAKAVTTAEATIKKNLDNQG